MFGWRTAPGKTSIPGVKAASDGGASISLGNLLRSSMPFSNLNDSVNP